jgi:hypothetical protein
MKFFALCGAGIWLAATLFLRIAGEYVLRPGDRVRMAVVFTVAFAAVFLLVRTLVRRNCRTPGEFPRAAAILCLPTLLLDPFSTLFFRSVFPNLPPAGQGPFAALMLWCCGAAILAGLTASTATEVHRRDGGPAAAPR